DDGVWAGGVFEDFFGVDVGGGAFEDDGAGVVYDGGEDLVEGEGADGLLGVEEFGVVFPDGLEGAAVSGEGDGGAGGIDAGLFDVEDELSGDDVGAGGGG